MRSGLPNVTLGLEELLALAAPLGADVPFVVRAAFPLGGLAVGEGTGTELRIVELPEDMIPARYCTGRRLRGALDPAGI